MPTDLPTHLAEVYALLDRAPAGDWGFRSIPANPDVPLTIAGGVNSAKAAIAAVNFLRTFRAELEAQAKEVEALRYEVADMHDCLRTLFIACPGLPIVPEHPEAFDAATDTLIGLCHMIGIYNVSVPDEDGPGVEDGPWATGWDERNGALRGAEGAG